MHELTRTQFIYLNERPIILHRVIPFGEDAYTIHYSYMEDHPKLCNQITVTSDGKAFMGQGLKASNNLTTESTKGAHSSLGRQCQYVFTTMTIDTMYDMV